MDFKKTHVSPFLYPIVFFGLTIFAGAALLTLPLSLNGTQLGWLDAIFTATSATCVTGLVVVDTGTHFSSFGQAVILSLIQLGGLGIMTYTSLIFYLWRKRVTLTDRLAVGQSLLHDPSFQLGRFLMHMVLWTLFIEGLGATLLHLFDPDGFPVFSAVFHAVSAFCNAGFGLKADSLMGWADNVGVNVVVMLLIILGGIGFSVIVELEGLARVRFSRVPKRFSRRPRLSWYSSVVLSTSFWLIVAGAAFLYFAEFLSFDRGETLGNAVLASFFQSVTCRTAGFNTLDIGNMTTLSLLAMIALMFIGASPASCGGGIKTTTFRALTAFGMSRLFGREQTVVGRYALDQSSMNKAITLVMWALLLVVVTTIVLVLTEGGDRPYPESGGLFLAVLFEVVSAFGTVGLSTGLTPHLSVTGKVVITLVMFIGRIGPILFLTVLQEYQEKPRFQWPEESILIG